MSKFRVRLKVQALELEVEGSREDVPRISSALGEGLANLLQQPAAVIETPQREPTTPALTGFEVKPLRRRNGRAKTDTGAMAATPLLNWVHDPAKWGNPQQSWSPLEKALWLMHVVSHETQDKELSAGAIANAFNQHFRQAGTIRASNVSRDLGKAKGRVPALVGENATARPSLWFLVDAGTLKARELITALVATPGA